jgi:hypothetical protein
MTDTYQFNELELQEESEQFHIEEPLVAIVSGCVEFEHVPADVEWGEGPTAKNIKVITIDEAREVRWWERSQEVEMDLSSTTSKNYRVVKGMIETYFNDNAHILAREATI